MDSVRRNPAAIFLWITCFILIQIRFTISQTTAIPVHDDVMPYVLFTTQFGVHRMMLNTDTGGSGGAVENLVVGGYGYGALDYHYERDLLFWVNEVFHCILQAKMSDGSAVTVLIDEETANPADITVDWINHRLYWVDEELREIWEYNMQDNTTRFIMSTGTVETSLPRAIVIYPYINNGWLYWTDQQNESLKMVSVHGGDKEILITGLPCLQAFTIDYVTHVVYWADRCLFEFQSLSLNGDRETHSYPFARVVYFVSSMAKFKDNLYWVEPTGIYTILRSGEGFRTVMAASSLSAPIAMQVVHPSHQPNVSEYEDIIMDTEMQYECNPPCLTGKGACIPPGFCACEKGWMGDVCDDDIDECTANTDGCGQICVNYAGGYNCSCIAGYALGQDLKTCLDIDECALSTDDCEQICTNYDGGYECSCYSGYSFSQDLTACQDIDECALNIDDCEQNCTNYDGGYSCNCHLGYSLSQDSKTCDDIDECALNIDGCGQICTNYNGGYNCSCHLGHSLNNDSNTCNGSITTQLSGTQTKSAIYNTLILTTHDKTLSHNPTVSTLFKSTPTQSTHYRSTQIVTASRTPTALLISKTSSIVSSTLPSLLTYIGASSIHTTLKPIPDHTSTIVSLLSIQTTTIFRSLSTYRPLSTSIDVITTSTVSPYTTLQASSAILSVHLSPTLGSRSLATHTEARVVTLAPTISTLIARTTPLGSSASNIISPSLLRSRGETSIAFTSTKESIATTPSIETITTSRISQVATTFQSSERVDSNADIRITATFGISLQSSSTIKTHPIPTVDLNPDLKWHEENKLPLIIIVLGVITALIGLVTFAVALIRRYRYRRGSWSPNNNFSITVFRAPPEKHAVRGVENVLASFMSSNEEDPE